MARDSRTGSIAAWVAASAPKGTAVQADWIGPELAFDAAEQEAVAGAVPARRDEFRTGRTLARRALAQLGCPPTSLPPDADRVPRWPRGFLGTISHSAGLCVAQVARTADLVGIGIDVEITDRLTPELAAMICRPDERMVDATNLRVDAVIARFVAKEALFKAYFPATRTFLDFVDLRVTLDSDGTRFVAELMNEASPGLCGARAWSGCLTVIENVVIAGVWIACS